MHVTEEQLRKATTFSARLKLALAAKGMEPIGLAKAIGARKQTVYYWLKGTTKNPDSINLGRCAARLGVRSEWLQNGELPMFAPPEVGEEEAQLVGYYAKMDPERRKSLMEIAESMAAKSATKPTAAVPYKSKART